MHDYDGWVGSDGYYRIIDGWLIGYYNRYKLVAVHPGLTDCAKVKYTYGQGQKVVRELGVVEYTDVFSNITGLRIA